MNDFSPDEWAARKANVASGLHGTTHEIIVAMLERIEALEREVAQLKPPATPPHEKRQPPLWGGRAVRDDAAFLQDGDDPAR